MLARRAWYDLLRTRGALWRSSLRDPQVTTRFRHVFGPVPSRRLGRSLGIDLVPFKTCTYDCIYCQLGRTRNRTVELSEYVPTDRVLAEIEFALGSGAHADWITLSGSGEPTLHA